MLIILFVVFIEKILINNKSLAFVIENHTTIKILTKKETLNI